MSDADRRRLSEVVRQAWGSTRVASRGRLVEAAELPGFLAVDDGEWVAYATYEIVGNAIEVVALEALRPNLGAGSAVLAECVGVAAESDLHRLWLITTNDNVAALRYYQRHGFLLVALHRDAVTHARRDLKPEIGLVGAEGIPIRDEIELELPRAEWADFMRRYRWAH